MEPKSNATQWIKKKKKEGGGGVLHIVLFLKSTYQRIYDLHIKYTTFGEL